MSGQRKLDPQEDKVIRMQRGFTAPDGMQLEWEGQDSPDVMAQLRALEERAFVESGRIDELRREAGVEDTKDTTKDKIVSKLKTSGQDASVSEEAEASVSSEASADKKSR